MKKTLLFLSLFAISQANAQLITTIAGTGTAGYSGDNGPATSAKLDRPSGVIIGPTRNDVAGYIYVADYANNAVRRIDPSGTITTIAGTGTAGYSGDGGPATVAKLNGPTHLFRDSVGNIYVSEFNNNVIRRIDIFGIISTIVGNGSAGYSGNGGAALSAQLHGPSGIVMDGAGNMFIADYTNNVIRKVNTSGIISTVAGTGTAGYSGDGGPATLAQLSGSVDVFVDQSDNIYIADGTNSRIRKVNTSGMISTVAGTGVNGYNGDGIAATAAQLFNPYGIVTDVYGNLYIADQNNARIRKVTTAGIISTIAGNGTPGYSGDGGPAISAEFNIPSGVCLDDNGYFYIADQWNHRIRKFSVCTAGISGQPTSDTVIEGTTTKFFVATSFPAPSYQWQENPGTGFVDLTNVWPYSGVTTDTLTIHNSSIYLNATSYRCIVNNGSFCPDTSSSATLTVHTGSAGVNQLSAASINIFPNPARDNIVVELPRQVTSGFIQILNELGETVIETAFTDSYAKINIGTLSSGLYIVRISANHQILNKKIFKE